MVLVAVGVLGTLVYQKLVHPVVVPVAQKLLKKAFK